MLFKILQSARSSLKRAPRDVQVSSFENSNHRVMAPTLASISQITIQFQFGTSSKKSDSSQTHPARHFWQVHLHLRTTLWLPWNAQKTLFLTDFSQETPEVDRAKNKGGFTLQTMDFRDDLSYQRAYHGSAVSAMFSRTCTSVRSDARQLYRSYDR